MPTRLYYADDQPAEYLNDFNGAFKALADARILTDIVLGRDLTMERLSAYRVLVLANVACLSDEQIAAITQYVAQGGGLVATHATSLYDELGNRRADFGLHDLLAVSYRAPVNYNTTFLQMTAGSLIAEGAPADNPLSLGTPQWKVEARPDADIAAWVVVPLVDYAVASRRITWGDPPPGMQTAHPAVVTRQYGKGRVVYFAGLPERAYFQRHYIHCRQMLVNAVRWAADAPPPVELAGGGGLKLTAFRQPALGRLVAHIVNLQAVPGHEVKPGPIEGAGQLNWAYPIEEIVPAHSVQVRIASDGNPPRRVYLAPEGTDLAYDVQDGWIRVTVPTVHYHTMVVVEGQAEG